MIAESASLTALGLTTIAIQSGLIVGILLGLRREFIPGALTLVALLPIIEWFAGGPFGYYGFGVSMVFMVCQGLRRRLRDGWGTTHFIVAAVAVVVHALIMVGAVGTSKGGEFFADAVLWALPSTILTVLVAIWPIQWLMARADAVYEGKARDAVFH
jgi:hypothetical protein